MQRGVIRCAAAALVCVIGAGAARPAAAQRVSIAPTIGVYVPTTELVKAASGDEFKHEAAITVGGRLGIWFGNRLGIEGTGTYIPSSLKFNDSGFGDASDANLFMGSGRVTLFLVPQSSPLSLALTGGASVVHRSGTFYEGATDRTDVGGVVGASAIFRLGRLLRLQVNADDYIYKTGADIPGYTASDATQNDIQLSVGVGIPLLGLGR